MVDRDSNLVARDAEVFFHQKGSSPCIGAVRGVSGIWIEDGEGRRLIDLHGNTAHHIGYGHPRLIAAVMRQLQELPFSPRRYTNGPAVALAETLVARWPGGRAKVLFATGGSDAIEIALKLARVATGRPETISLRGSYHGHGFGAFGLSSDAIDPRLGPFLPGRHHVTPYWAGPDGADLMLSRIAGLLATRPGIGALIAEPMRSNCRVPPAGLWPAVRALCDRHGVKLIFDEIPSGLGKTGRFFAFEHFGAIPDAVVLGKALGGGVLPIAAVIADAALDVAPELALGHYTHEKNPVTTVAALTTIEIIDDEDLVVRAWVIEKRLRAALSSDDVGSGFIDHVRGLGALLALGFKPDRVGPSPGLVSIGRVVDAFRRCGLSTTEKDASSVGLSVPLVATDAELDLIVERIDSALAICANAGPG